MNTEVLKNPIVLYRGSDIPKDWYERMSAQSEPIRDLIRELEETGKRAEAALDEAVSRLERLFAETKNPDLLNLKRDLFNKRLGKLRNALEKPGPAGMLEAIRTYVERETEHEAAMDEYREGYRQSMTANRQALWESAADEDLAKSIAFYNDEIYEKLGRYLSAEPDAHNKKLKKLDFFLMKLLVRGSMKTSPFSYLTKTGLAGQEDLEFERRSFCEMNHSIMLKIVHQFIRTDPDALRNIPVKVERFGVRGGRIYYVSQHSVDHSRKVFETSDKFVEYSLHPKLIRFLSGQKQKTLTYEAFAEQAAKIPEYRGEEGALFAKLISLKLLRQQAGLSNDRGILGSAKELFRTFGIGERLLPQLDELDTELEAFESKPAFERIRHWKRIRELVRDMSPESDAGRELVYEDVIFGRTKPDLVSGLVDGEFMKTLGDFLLLFDVNVRVQYEIGCLFSDKYGHEARPLTDSRLLNEVFFKKIHHFYPYYQDQRYRYQEAVSDEVRLLDRLRDEFLDEFEGLLEAMSGEAEVEAGELIRAYSGRIPDYIKRDTDVSSSLFLQYAGAGTVVLNDVYDGHEKFISRFKDFFGPAGTNPDYEEYVDRVFRDRNYYEVDELFGFNGGIHYRKDLKTAKLEVGYRQFSDDGGHPVADMTVRYDPDTRKLDFLDRDGRSCRITYKSSLVPIFLPGILSVMLHLFQSGRLNFDLASLARPYSRAPRIRMGNVVLSRRKWRLDTEKLTQLIRGAADAEELYLNVNRYFDEQQLPKRFFLKYFRNEGEFTVEKPMFFDVTVPLLLKFFANELKDGAYLEELLPDADIPLNEFLVEYSLEKERTTCKTSLSKV
ncbi:lantibiotic dehydratase [Edaphobacillus lindanitolerans]|uniref:Lantibiotic dehydratase, C terminus n=1 Tax=Edaphobacillus lindanitolerans TaxID=550447 RepID=A0A1U7PRC6_9BACI|nr:lantibiotic dehydratase [Edaphobacillus lindanitolerans]SIT87205.1 Lantibiotic dehydratase, C terminus [Edaphobacillus lindanitolerans]